MIKSMLTGVKNAIETKYAIARQTKSDNPLNPKLAKHLKEIEKNSKKMIAQKLAIAKEKIRVI